METIRRQVGSGRRTPPAVAQRQLEVASAFLSGSIEVEVSRYAHSFGSSQIGIHQGMLRFQVSHAQRPPGAAPPIRAAFLVLHFTEDRQHVGPAPASRSRSDPAIIVLGLPADVEQPVYRRTASHDLAARPFDPTVVKLRLRFGTVSPGEARARLGPIIPDRNVNLGVAITRPSLDKSHGAALTPREPGRQCAACRSGTNYYITVGVAQGHALAPVKDGTVSALVMVRGQLISLVSQSKGNLFPRRERLLEREIGSGCA